MSFGLERHALLFLVRIPTLKMLLSFHWDKVFLWGLLSAGGKGFMVFQDFLVCFSSVETGLLRASLVAVVSFSFLFFYKICNSLIVTYKSLQGL